MELKYETAVFKATMFIWRSGWQLLVKYLLVIENQGTL